MSDPPSSPSTFSRGQHRVDEGRSHDRHAIRAPGRRTVDHRRVPARSGKGRSGDGGVDITAVAPGGTPYAIQCKRYGGSVGAPAVRNFLGALANAFNGHTGILITSGRLTDQARTEALNARQPLILLERDHLADWLIGQRTILTRPMRLAEADDPAT
ncbi:restriction endonuclease [Nonomuraea antimicrobica]